MIFQSLILLMALNFSFGDSVVNMTKRDQVWVNEACSENCQAISEGKKPKTKISSSDLKGGKNPASVRCTKVFKGVVVIGLDPKGNQQSFCSFPDGSYLKN